MLYNLITIVLINTSLKKNPRHFCRGFFGGDETWSLKPTIINKHLIAAQSKYLQPLSTLNISNTYFHRLVLSIILLKFIF